MRATGLRRVFLLGTVCLAGAATMGLELAGIRLLAPWYGSSVYVWGAMIGVILVALALGYAFGGRAADRAESELPLFIAVTVAGLWQLGMLFVSQPVLAALAELDEVAGPAAASVLLFAVPMALLAAAGPFAVRFVASADDVGAAAGEISALNTVGGVLGIAATSFYLLPTYGTHDTLTLWCATTLIVGIFGLVTVYMWAAAALGVLSLLPLATNAKAPAQAIWSAESAYNQVHVLQAGDARALQLNADWSLHSIRRSDGWTGRYYDDFALGPLLVPDAARSLILGMGAGASLGPTWSAAPEMRVDAVEIDPVVVEAAERFFEVDPSDERLTVHVADARPWLARQPDVWDIAQVDLYHGGPYTPFYLATTEFYASIRDHLSSDGLVMLNVFDSSAELALLNPTSATLDQVFGTPQFVLHRPSGNHTLFVFAEATSLEAARARLSSGHPDERVAAVAQRAAAALQPFNAPAGALVFTDDHAPIEAITRSMFLQHQVTP